MKRNFDRTEKYSHEDKKELEFDHNLQCEGKTIQKVLELDGRGDEYKPAVEDMEEYMKVLNIFYGVVEKLVMRNMRFNINTRSKKRIRKRSNKSDSDNESNDDYTYTSVADLNVGDLVTVTYLPDSQKYIPECNDAKFTGKVFYVDADEDNALMYKIDKDDDGKDTITTRSIEIDCMSYLGTSRGWVYHIERH